MKAQFHSSFLSKKQSQQPRRVLSSSYSPHCFRFIQSRSLSPVHPYIHRFVRIIVSKTVLFTFLTRFFQSKNLQLFTTKILMHWPLDFSINYLWRIWRVCDDGECRKYLQIFKERNSFRLLIDYLAPLHESERVCTGLCGRASRRVRTLSIGHSGRAGYKLEPNQVENINLLFV